MKLKTLLLALLCAATVQAQNKLVGGDLSLVPAYEAVGEVWLDADGNSINDTYSDGMITFVKEKAKWNSVRVRLLVDPTADDKLATCQDLDYVKKLGKRIKDAGMNFLLDIFYSDTWTDVSQQWIPASWGYNRSTATATLAAKVKSYTTEVLNELVAYGAKPDYIQLGNEVSYGMLWDSASGASKNNYFVTSGTYEGQQAKIQRFVTLLQAARDGVSASNASSAKIILHCERTVNGTHCVNFYKWVNQAGFTNYDIMGLSYYPFWHGNLSKLKTTLTNLQAEFPSKEIHIVETGYFNNTGVDATNLDYDTSSDWSFSFAGQAAFLTDLVSTLSTYSNVKALYYWQPEECGNGADDGGTSRVMDGWDNRGLWSLSWKSGQHSLDGNESLTALMKFIGETPDESGSSETDVTSNFQNMDFENGTTEANIIWTMNKSQGWGDYWVKDKNDWHSALTGGSYLYQTWVSSASSLSAGNIIYQSASSMPAGEYTVSAAVHCDYDGIYLFANDDQTKVTATSDWGTAYTVSVTTTLTEAGTLTIGLTLPTAPTSTSEVNLYADNFKVTYTATSVNNITADEAKTRDNRWYNLSGQRISEPKTKGIYINNGKIIVKK